MKFSFLETGVLRQGCKVGTECREGRSRASNRCVIAELRSRFPASRRVPLPQPASFTNLEGFVSDAGYARAGYPRGLGH
jgi:hypothetical protein